MGIYHISHLVQNSFMHSTNKNALRKHDDNTMGPKYITSQDTPEVHYRLKILRRACDQDHRGQANGVAKK